jgi:hypothetical protein
MKVPDKTYKLTDEEQYYTIKTASSESVSEVLSSSVRDPDGRSQWVWVRLPDGDLVLGIFPQGDTYELTERDHP